MAHPCVLTSSYTVYLQNLPIDEQTHVPANREMDGWGLRLALNIFFDWST